MSSCHQPNQPTGFSAITDRSNKMINTSIGLTSLTQHDIIDIEFTIQFALKNTKTKCIYPLLDFFT